MPPDPQQLFEELSRKIADGEAIDWAAYDGADEAVREVVDQLRVLAGVAGLHRETLPSLDTPSAVPPPPPLASGDTWGHLTIRGTLGRGAHSHVYRAWDPQLDREVALKLTVDVDEADSRAIIGEARLLAKVRHPNVAMLYGAERRDGLVGLWMEVVDGATLEALVQRLGRFSAREAALIGTEICAALSAVHAAGLLHRDIKAQNVMRDRHGRIVLMDLGMGRDVAPMADAFVHDEVGTPLYMAPELFTGGKATVQSDVYGLGVLLYRLVTGALPIDASSASSLREAHRTGAHVPINERRSDLPVTFVRVVERALAARADDRYPSAGALGLALSRVQVPDAPDDATVPPRGKAMLAALGGAALAAAAFGPLSWMATAPGAPAEIRFDVTPVGADGVESVALAPDGQRLAYTAGGQLRLRRLNDVSAVALEPSQGTRDPFWAPDGQAIAFFGGVSLWRVSPWGGEPQFVATARRPSGGHWGADGTIVFSAENGQAIMAVPATGGPPRVLRSQVPGLRTSLWWPSLVGDGSTLIYSAIDAGTGRRTVFVGRVADAPTTRDQVLLELESNPVVAGDWLFVVRDAQLQAQRLDARTGRPTGPVSTVANGVASDPYGAGQVAVSASASGSLAFVPTVAEVRTLRLVDRSGTPLGDIGSGDIRDLRVSPDGTMIAYEAYDPDTGTRDIWTADLTRRSATRLSQHPAHDIAPTWAPDGRTVYYVSLRGANPTLVASPAQGGGAEHVIFDFDAGALPYCVTPDGRAIVYERQDQRTGWDIWLRDFDGGGTRVLVRGPANEQEPSVSPDGRWLAYSSPESEGRQVYLTPVAGGRRWRVSREHGRQPLWSRDGRTLFFHGHDRQLMEVRVDASGDQPVIGPPRALFVIPFRGYDLRYHYGVVADAAQFVVNVPPPVLAPVPARVILHPSLP